MIRNIIFDMGGVLISWHPELFIDRLGVAEADRPLLLREVFGSVEWIQMDRGVLSFEDASSSMCRRLPERLHGTVRELVFDWWKRPLVPMEGMADLVREVRSLGYGVYLLSNASVDLPRYFGRIPGSECFDGRIVSAEWKLLKPQPEIYRLLLRQFGLKAEECFFVADLSINVEAAVYTGMSGAIFRGAEDLRRDLSRAGVPVGPGPDGA